MTDTPLLFDRLTAEWALAHACHASVQSHVAHLEQRITLLRATLTGLAANGTDCGACRMSREVAAQRLAKDDALACYTQAAPSV